MILAANSCWKSDSRSTLFVAADGDEGDLTTRDDADEPSFFLLLLVLLKGDAASGLVVVVVLFCSSPNCDSKEEEEEVEGGGRKEDKLERQRAVPGEGLGIASLLESDP